jgi:hypothetical protein
MVAAQLRTDFTGLWKVNLEKSVLRGPAPKEILMKIEHREPMLNQQILLIDAGGTRRRQAFAFGIGGEWANPVGGSTARTRAQWEGTELVIESWMKTPERELHFKDHWSLSRDGQTLAMAHRDDDLAGQITILERALGASATGFDE